MYTEDEAATCGIYKEMRKTEATAEVNLSRHTTCEDAVAPGNNYKDMLATKASVEAVEAFRPHKRQRRGRSLQQLRGDARHPGCSGGRWYLQGAQKTQTRQELQGDAPDGRCSGAR